MDLLRGGLFASICILSELKENIADFKTKSLFGERNQLASVAKMTLCIFLSEMLTLLNDDV